MPMDISSLAAAFATDVASCITHAASFGVIVGSMPIYTTGTRRNALWSMILADTPFPLPSTMQPAGVQKSSSFRTGNGSPSYTKDRTFQFASFANSRTPASMSACALPIEVENTRMVFMPGIISCLSADFAIGALIFA